MGLDLEEQLCLAFQCVPSQLSSIYWRNTYRDIQTQLKLVVGLKTVELTQNYENLLKVAGAVMGGGEEKPHTNAPEPKNDAEAMALANAVFS